MTEKINQKGFIQIPLLIRIIVAVVIASAVGTGFVLHRQGKLDFLSTNVSQIVEEDIPTTDSTTTQEQELEQARLETEKARQETELLKQQLEEQKRKEQQELNQRLLQIEQERLELERQRAQREAEQEAKISQNKALLDSCLADAKTKYNTCLDGAETYKKQCLGLANGSPATIEICFMYYGEISVSCSQGFQDLKNDCYNLYPQY